MTEPDVALTDYGLAIENAVFAYLLIRRRTPLDPGTGWFVAFFAAASLAALAGGTVHGFFLDERTLGARILWPATLFAIGLSALSAWAIGAHLLLSARGAQIVVVAAALEFLVYGAVLLGVTQAFEVAVANYLPAALFLLVVFGLTYRHTRRPAALAALVGLALTFVAAGVQVGRVALHPVYFNHNALYHMIQALALLLLFIGARGDLSRARR
jgi:hypothetical protein